MQNNYNSYEEQIERLKQELALYLQIAEKLEFPREEVEKQINRYLDEINKLNSEEND